MGSEEQLSLALKIVIEKEVDGLEMGVLEDGTPYLSAAGVARLCGTAKSTILERAKEWKDGDRAGRLPKFLVAKGFDRDSLYVPVRGMRGVEHAYADDVATLLLW
jgi:hypothetical protein